MANDKSINSVSSSDSSNSVLRKKPNTESIDVRMLSFFDELLSIGQFKSSVPDATGLPSLPPGTSDHDRDNKSAEEPSQESSSRQPDDTIDSSAVQSAASQALAQQQLIPTAQQPQTLGPEKNLEPESLGFLSANDKKDSIQPGDNPVVAKNSQYVDSAKDLAKRDQKNAVATDPLASSLSPIAKGDSLPANLKKNHGEKEAKTQSATERDLKKSKQIQESRVQSNTPDANSEQGKKGRGISQTSSNRVPTLDGAAASKQTVEIGNAEANVTQPRNKRADRLARRAVENDPVPDDSNPSSGSSKLMEAVGVVATTETPDESALTVTSPPDNLSLMQSISPVIAPPIALVNNATSASTNSLPSVEAISAAGTSTTRGGVETNTSNTTVSSSVYSQGRAEQGRGEVARSNAGTQISAYQEVKLVQRVLRGVEQLANGGGQVRLRLHPPELGSLQMSLRIEAGQVFAKLEVENSTARDALLNNVQTLKDRMAEQGLNVASFEVEVSTDSSGSGTGGSDLNRDGGSGSESRWGNTTSRFAQQNNNRLSSEPVLPERKSGSAWSRTNGSLDLTV